MWISLAHLHQARDSSIKWIFREHTLSCIINVTWQERKERGQSVHALQMSWINPYTWWFIQIPWSQLHGGDLEEVCWGIVWRTKPRKGRWQQDWNEGEDEQCCHCIRGLSWACRKQWPLRGISKWSQRPAFPPLYEPVTGCRTSLREERETFGEEAPFTEDTPVGHQSTGGITAPVLKGGSC